MLHSLARIYWSTAAVIGTLLAIGAGTLASTWLGASKLPTDEVRRALTVMAGLVAARWPIALYQNALVGAGRLLTVSVVNMAMSSMSVLCAVMVLSFLTPRVDTMFAAQAAVSVVHALLMRQNAWRALGGRCGVESNLASLGGMWQFSARMAIVALTGVALTQLDKTVLSKALPLAAFGEYMLGATIVGGLAVFITPLFNTIYPELSALVARGRFDLLLQKYHRDTKIFSTFFLPIALTLGIHSLDIVWLWTGRPETAQHIAPIVALLCAGSAINGVMYFPYAAQLAFGLSWMPLAINVALLIVFAPLIVTLSMSYGGIGGAAAWALLEVIYLALGTYLTHRHIELGRARAWIWKCLVPSLVAAAGSQLLWFPVVELASPGSAVRVGLIAVGTVISMATCALINPEVRVIGLAEWRRHGPSSIKKPA